MAKELIEDCVKEEDMRWSGGGCRIKHSQPALVDICSEAEEEVKLEDEKEGVKTEVQDDCIDVVDKVEATEGE